jgi:hypothetical protein
VGVVCLIVLGIFHNTVSTCIKVLVALVSLVFFSLFYRTQITGNLAKLVLGSASIVFDLIFFLQHYVLYKSAASSAATTTPTTPLLVSNNNNSSYEQLLQASDNNEGTATAGDETRDIDEGPIHSFV